MRKLFIFLLVASLMIPVWAGAAGSYAAGDLSKTALDDSLEEGNQVTFTIGLELPKEGDLSEREKALANLLAQFNASVSAYRMNGTMSGTMNLTMGENQLAEAQYALNLNNGELHFATSLTDDRLFVIPGNDFISSGMTFEDMLYGALGEQNESEDFESLPALERLRITAADAISLVLKVLLGWTSGNQEDLEGEFYQFDFDYIEATEIRDGVAQRMIGKIYTDQLCALLWDVSSMLDTQAGDFQQALADVLAEAGVTRIQARAFIDMLMPDIAIDPATDYVEPSYTIPDDGTLIQYNDVSYFFKKANRFTDKIWEESLHDEDLSMIVSYDDYGTMVGFDAYLPKFTENLPYEGSFSYSIHTDDDWQVLTTAHGELQISDTARVYGDYQHLNGEDIDDVNENTLDGKLIIVDNADESSNGFGINGYWKYEVSEEAGLYQEVINGNGSVSLYTNDDATDLVSVAAESHMQTTGDEFSLSAYVDVSTLADTIRVRILGNQSGIDTVNLPTGDEVNILQMSDETKEEIQASVQTKLFSLLLTLMNDETLMNNVNVVLQ